MPPRVQKSCSSLASTTANALTSKAQARLFSTTPQNATRLRRDMWRWLNTQGTNFRHPLPGSTNYLSAYGKDGRLLRAGAQQRGESDGDETDNFSPGSLPRERLKDLEPFPLNKHFRSQPVLSDGFREAIWTKIIKDGMSVREVSTQLKVEMNRVAAVVRLKEIEKNWAREGKQFAKPYAKAVMAMLPQTQYSQQRPAYHESINDLPVHAATATQIFYPTSESRHFTREDAARVFDENLLPADKRVPHPQLTEFEKDRLSGLPMKEVFARDEQRRQAENKSRLLAEENKRKWEEKNITKVDTGRWQFRFQEIRVDDAGSDGRGLGTGWRYGAPLMDRKRGQVKIPTRVM